MPTDQRHDRAAGCGTFYLPALFGFAAGPVCREYRFWFRLLGGFLARPLQLLRRTGLLFDSLMTCPLQFLRSADLLFDPQRFRLGSGCLGALTLFARLLLGFPCGDPESASGGDRLSFLAPLGRFGARRGGLGAPDLRLLGFLGSAQPVGQVRDSRLGHLAISPEFAESHPINALGKCNLGMFAVADLTAEGAATSVPAHRIAGLPNRRNPRRPLASAARIPLACLARRAARQSRSSRHFDFPLRQVPSFSA